MKKFFLVTAGFGLLGVSVVNFLVKKKFTVVILDYKNYRKNFFQSNKNIIIEKGNFCKKKFVEKIFKKYKFSGIFSFRSSNSSFKSIKKSI